MARDQAAASSFEKPLPPSSSPSTFLSPTSLASTFLPLTNNSSNIVARKGSMTFQKSELSKLYRVRSYEKFLSPFCIYENSNLIFAASRSETFNSALQW